MEMETEVDMEIMETVVLSRPLVGKYQCAAQTKTDSTKRVKCLGLNINDAEQANAKPLLPKLSTSNSGAILHGLLPDATSKAHPFYYQARICGILMIGQQIITTVYCP